MRSALGGFQNIIKNPIESALGGQRVRHAKFSNNYKQWFWVFSLNDLKPQNVTLNLSVKLTRHFTTK